jgi:3-oxoacyl-[acyl-carrier protein] reductase
MDNLKQILFEEIQVGQKASFSRKISKSDIETFANLTGDFNPLHINSNFAAEFGYPSPVAHGMLSASFISTLIGTLLPGPGSLWIGLSLEFVSPVFAGETIEIEGEVKQKSIVARLIVLETRVINSKGEVIIRGESKVKMLHEKKNSLEPTVRKKKTVLILGASGGIGSEISKSVAKTGNSVLIHYYSDETKAKEIAAEINKDHGSAEIIQADLSSHKGVEELLNQINKKNLNVDALIHCASPENSPISFHQLKWEDVQLQIDVNLKSIFSILQRLIPRMIENGGGNIVLVGSAYTSGTPPINQFRYIVAKSTIVSAAKCLAVEFGPQNIKINVISPGMTNTIMNSTIPEKVKLMTKMQTPLRRIAEPTDIAELTAFLLTPGGEHISGQNYRIDGGMVMD